MRDMGIDGVTSDGREDLPPVPLFQVQPPAAETLMRLAPERLQELMAEIRRCYGNALLALGDRVTWRWLERTGNPYRHEIDGVRRCLGRPGAVMLNMSYEWSCSAGVGVDPSGIGSRLLRTLDWPLPGLGRALVVARQQGTAGCYYNVTWPGYVGSADGDGARPLQRRDQSTAIAPVHRLVATRLGAGAVLDIPLWWTAALASATAGIRRVPRL